MDILHCWECCGSRKLEKAGEQQQASRGSGPTSHGSRSLREVMQMDLQDLSPIESGTVDFVSSVRLGDAGAALEAGKLCSENSTPRSTMYYGFSKRFAARRW